MNRLLTLAGMAAELAEWIVRTLHRFSATLVRLRWLSPTLARLTVGLVFVQSGWGKLHATVASTAEVVAGGLLLLGLATRVVVVPLIVTLGVAIATAQSGPIELAYVALLVWLGIDGPGPLSLDHVIAHAVTPPRPARPAGRVVLRPVPMRRATA